jgi:hypothetical protein
MKNKKKILIVILLVFLVGVFFLLPVVQAGNGVELPATTELSNVKIKTILTSLLTWLLGIVGVIALIGFVVSGIQYIVASGNDKMIESAKKNMTYSLIGITVVLASYVIIQALDALIKGGSEL